jgi:hypothetical protein
MSCTSCACIPTGSVTSCPGYPGEASASSCTGDESTGVTVSCIDGP